MECYIHNVHCSSSVWRAWARVVMDFSTVDDIYSFYFITHNPPVQGLEACGRRYTLLDSLSASLQLLDLNFKLKMNEFMLLVEPVFWAMSALWFWGDNQRMESNFMGCHLQWLHYIFVVFICAHAYVYILHICVYACMWQYITGQRYIIM